MAEELKIQITAQDGTTKVFKAISSGADDVGKSVEDAGKRGKKGMDELGRSAEDNARRMERMKAEATAIGAALGVLGAGLIKTGQSARDQRLQIEALNRMYGDAAEGILDYAEAMQDMTMVSNDQARQSAQIFATLTQNYGLSIQQVEQLMMRAADLSTLFGKNVTDTSQMIQNALRGEAEYIEQVNITLNDNFVAAEAARRGIEGWTTTMTDAEKAAFRFQLFMEQSEYATGAAADEAERAGGRFRQFMNDVQDAGQAVGTFTGPVGEVAAELAPIAMALPVVSAGLGNLVGRLRGSTLAMSALGMAMNPVALGLGALTVAGIATWSMFQDGQAEAKALEDALISLGDVAENLRLGGRFEEAGFVDEFIKQTDEAIELGQMWLNDLDYMQLQAARRADEWGVSQTDALYMVQEAYEFTKEEAEQFADAQTRIGAAFADSRIDHEALNAALNDLHMRYYAGVITLDEYKDGLVDIAQNTSRFSVNATEAEQAATGLAAAFGLLQSEGAGLLDTILNLNTVTEDDSFADRLLKTLGLDASQRGQIDSITEQVRGLRVELEDMPEPGATQDEWLDWVNQEGISQQERTRRINAANEARREEESSTRMATIAEAAHTSALEAGNAAMDEHAARTDMALQIGESWNAHLEERNALIEENIARLQEAGGVADPLSQWNLGEYATDMSRLADATLDAATALDTVFRVIVSNTDAIGNQVDSVEKWALELINVRGEYGLIDDLLAAGTITLQEYNAAQEAQETISAANLAIQEDILTIQARQAPLIADHTAALADQMDLISVMPAQQQLIALGWMDATTAGRAMEFQTLAVAAAAGELGANGEEAFTSMITGAAQADPVLKALLIDMGLISEGADGTITVNLDGAEQAQSDLELLATTVADLIDLLDDGIMNASYQLKVDMETSVNGEPTGTEGIAGVLQGLLDNVTGQDAEVDLEVKPQLPPNAGELLQQSFGGQAVEIEVAPVIRAGMDWLGGGIGALLGGDGGPQDTTVTIDAVDNATPVIDGITAQLTALGAWDATIDISVPNAYTAIGDLNGVQAAAEAVPDTVYTWTGVLGDVDAIGSLNGVEAAAEAIPNSVITVISAVDNASAVIGDAVDFLASVDGYESTMTLNIVTNQITRVSNNRHGGIPGYAHGGVIAELAEAGPEVLHFASGGTATVFDRGIYSVPPGTYVSPNNTYSTSYGAPMVNVNVTVQGSVMAEEDLADTITAKLAPALSEAMSVHYREQGMPW